MKTLNASATNETAIAATMNVLADAWNVQDDKTTQLLLFSILIYAGTPAAKYHAIAARRAGATWEELQKVIELAAAACASSPMNIGGSVLQELRKDEE